MADRPYNVLFLCTGNSARSIIGEAILNKLGAGNFRAYSAGSQPKGQINPNTIQLLRSLGYDTSGYRSKSWDEFAKAGEPKFDFVFTVCDNAAAEACPVWPGQPMTAHWGVPDPAAAAGNEAEIRLAFADAFRMLNNRISIFVSLPIGSLDKLALQTDLGELGRFIVTRNRGDIGAFKTEQLRNIGITAPYMHDGSLKTLWDVIDHYNKGGETNAYLDGGIEPLDLSESEVNELVEFLFTLTDRRFSAENSAAFSEQQKAAAVKRPFRDDALAHRHVLPFEKRVLGDAGIR